MSNLNYNTALQSNNTDLQAILDAINELPEAGSSGEQAIPTISVNSTNGLITAMAGTKSSTHQLAFQPAKIITPSISSQIAVSSGYYTGGDITVEAVPTQTKSVTPKSTNQNVTPDSGKFLSNVTVNGDSNLVAENIKTGVSIFGVNGIYDGSGIEYSEYEDAIINRTISSYTNTRVTTIGSYAFNGCTKLTSIDLPVATIISEYAFNGCTKLTSINCPAATIIANYAFNKCTNLTNISFPAASYLHGRTFINCSNLTSIDLPVATTIGHWAFDGCTNLTSINLPAATTIGSYAFNGCTKLTSINCPAASYLYYNTFNKCTNLTNISFPAATVIDNYAFANCYNLSKLYLMGSSVCTLSNIYAFISTPYMGYSSYFSGTPYIYVPASLVTAYQSATNWAHFSSYFSAVEDLPT